MSIWFFYGLIVHCWIIDLVDFDSHTALYTFLRYTSTFGLSDEEAFVPFFWIPALCGFVGISGALLRMDYSISRRIQYAVYPLIISLVAGLVFLCVYFTVLYAIVAPVFLIVWTTVDIVLGCKMKFD